MITIVYSYAVSNISTKDDIHYSLRQKFAANAAAYYE